MIRFSPPWSLDLRATLPELSSLRESVCEVARGERSSLVVETDTSVDPHPYDTCLGPLRVSRSGGPTRVSVAPDGAVEVSGSPSNLESFAAYLQPTAGSHAHYEYYDGNPLISPDSVPLVVAATRG